MFTEHIGQFCIGFPGQTDDISTRFTQTDQGIGDIGDPDVGNSFRPA